MLFQRSGALARALKLLVRALPKRPTNPNLEHVRFEPAESGVALTTSDGTTHLRVVVPASDPFEARVPVKALAEFVREIERDAPVELQLAGDKVVVATDGALLELPTRSAPEFPVPAGPIGEAQVVDAKKFGDALRWALAAVGDDPTRAQLHAVLLEGQHVVGCDGSRLHLSTVQGMKIPRTAVPAKAASLLHRVLPTRGQVEIAVDERAIRFAAGAWTITTAPVPHEYPHWKHVVPAMAAAAFSMHVDAGALAAGVRRVARTSRGMSVKPIRIRANGAIRLESAAADTQLSAEVAVLASTHTGDDDHVQGFNGRYLTDAIVDEEGDAELRFYGVLDPVVIENGDGRVAVVMPWRL